ncbi:MAG: H+/Na+-translocating ferredoxin:NAD+ oxidoreductase subunit [Candidatus Atribacteria bacterium]|nr:H+/Na+-translocating ferredoxin:NAD+ oxidoreductase subunit [Candidatus Atribacteria bacterium]
MKKILQTALILGLVCVVAAFSLALVNQLTQAEIERRAREELELALKQVFPQAEEFKEVEPEGLNLPWERENFSLLQIFVVQAAGERVGFVFEATSTGYGGPIRLLIGISSRENELVGIQILDHQETPGLGSNITSPDFIGQFYSKSLTDPFTIGEDIEAIAGATISSQAVTRACREVVSYLEEVENL